MSVQLPLTEDDLRVVTTFVDQIVARGLMTASSAEIETIRRLVRDHRTHQQNTSERLAYLRDAGIGYFTDEILTAAKCLAEVIVGKHSDLRLLAKNGQGHWLAQVVLGDRRALDHVAEALKEHP